MNFVSPEDADLIDVGSMSQSEKQTVALALTSDEEPIEQPLPTALESAATTIVDLHERLVEMESLIEKRKTVLENQKETIGGIEARLESLTDTVEDTHDQVREQETQLATIEEAVDRLEDLQTAVASVEGNLEKVKQTATKAADRTAEQDQNLSVIQTALFDETYPCPICNEGTISRNSLASAVVCDSCDFEKSAIV